MTFMFMILTMAITNVAYLLHLPPDFLQQLLIENTALKPENNINASSLIDSTFDVLYIISGSTNLWLLD